MSDRELTAEDFDDQDEDDGDWRDYDDDPDYDREPDYAIARDYAEYAGHCETVHGGGECDCSPSLVARARQAGRRIGNWLREPWWRLVRASFDPWTARVGPVEVTLRLRASRRCGACGGKGWFYTLVPGRPDDRPPGHNGAALCGCGSAIASLAETRRHLRSARGEPPF